MPRSNYSSFLSFASNKINPITENKTTTGRLGSTSTSASILIVASARSKTVLTPAPDKNSLFMTCSLVGFTILVAAMHPGPLKRRP